MMEKRESWVDALRGLAICLMVPANMSPLISSHPWAFRFVSSLAAPIFVIVAGMMVARTAAHHTLSHYIQRSALILLCGALVDILAYQTLPFRTCDVLYLLGFSLPLVFFVNKLDWKLIATLSILIFALTPLLEHWLGYTNTPQSYDLSGSPIVDSDLVTTGLINHYVIDGYFPFFPWTGLMLFGLLLERLHWSDTPNGYRWRNFWSLPVAAALIIFGIIVWRYRPGLLLEREGYSEMFYNPTIGFILTAIGCFLILYWITFHTQFSGIWSPLHALGEASLFMYVFHMIVIGRFLAKIGSIGESEAMYLSLSSVLLLATMIVFGYCLKFAKKLINNVTTRAGRFGISASLLVSGLILFTILLQKPPSTITTVARSEGSKVTGGACRWENLTWGGMSKQARQAWETLGWSRVMWDSDDANAPASSSKDWSELSDTERKAAEGLGYDAKTWGVDCGTHDPVKQPPK